MAAKAKKLNKKFYLVTDPKDTIIKAVKTEKVTEINKTRLFLDVDGTLVAMIFNPDYTKKEVNWDSVHRTDFCHWINSIHSVINQLCEVIVLTNFTYDNEKANKTKWLKENLKCEYRLILNKEGITKSLFVRGKHDILVDDTLRNLIEWNNAGGSQVAYQWVTCEKGRRELLEILVGLSKRGIK